MNRIVSADNIVHLWISPQLEEEFKTIFEIEMLQGTREILEDGSIYFIFEVTPEKREATRLALIQYISKSKDIIFN